MDANSSLKLKHCKDVCPSKQIELLPQWNSLFNTKLISRSFLKLFNHFFSKWNSFLVYQICLIQFFTQIRVAYNINCFVCKSAISNCLILISILLSFLLRTYIMRLIAFFFILIPDLMNLSIYNIMLFVVILFE